MRRQKKIASILIFTFVFHIVAPLSLVHAQESKVISRLRIPVAPNTIVELENGSPKLQVTDYQASTRLILGLDGNESNVNYSPYGETGIDQKSYHLYTNHRRLEDLSVYHAGARFYSPTTGTFIQPDMVEGPVRYSYGHNNPITFSDPTGNSAYAGGNEGGSGRGPEMNITSLGNRRHSSLDSIGATGTMDEVRMDRDIMTDNQFFATQVVGGAMGLAALTVATAGTDLAVFGGASGVAAESSGGVATGSFAIRSLGIKVAKDFAIGAGTSGGFEYAMEKASTGKANWSDVGRVAMYGGISQALSWGLLSPEKFSMLPSLARQLPAIALDSAIWTPYSLNEEKDYSFKNVALTYVAQLAFQGIFQVGIGGTNRLFRFIGGGQETRLLGMEAGDLLAIGGMLESMGISWAKRKLSE